MFAENVHDETVEKVKVWKAFQIFIPFIISAHIQNELFRRA